MGRIRTSLLSAIALVAVMAPAGPALADVAFASARDVAVPVEATALSAVGPGLAVDPASGATVPVEKVALLSADPAQAVTVIALGRSGDAVGAPSVGSLPAGSAPRAMVTADLNGDGRPEIIVASSLAGADSVSVFSVPNVAGPLPAPTSVAAGPTSVAWTVTGLGSAGLAVADLVGGPSPDVALINSDGVAVLPGDGTGGLGPPQLVVPLPAGSGPVLLTGLRAADVTGDGGADLVLAIHYLGALSSLSVGPSGSVETHAAIGGGNFGFVIDRGAPLTGAYAQSMQLIDMDGDGRLDLVLAGFAYFFTQAAGVTPFGEIRFGSGTGLFDDVVAYRQGPTPLFSGAPPPGPVAAVAADMDLDRLPDLVTASGRPSTDPPTLDFRRGLPGRMLADPVSIPIPASTGVFAPVDLTGDGAPDLVLGRGSQPQTLAVLTALPVLAGSGLDFGEQLLAASAPPRSLEVTNTGGAPARLGPATLTGAAAGDFSIINDGCAGQTLAAGGRCSVLVGFRPLSAPLREEAALHISAQEGVSRDFPLSGSGTPVPILPAVPPGEVPTARAGCATRPTDGGMRLRCGLVLGPGATVSRVALRLVRGGRVRALADVRAGGRLVLRARRPLIAGRCTLVAVVVVADGRTRQTRREVMIRPPS